MKLVTREGSDVGELKKLKLTNDIITEISLQNDYDITKKELNNLIKKKLLFIYEMISDTRKALVISPEDITKERHSWFDETNTRVALLSNIKKEKVKIIINHNEYWVISPIPRLIENTSFIQKIKNLFRTIFQRNSKDVKN